VAVHRALRRLQGSKAPLGPSLCGSSSNTFPLIRPVTIGLLLFAAVVTIPTEWNYPPYKQTNFASNATAFEHSPPGTTAEFALNPTGWSMTLIRR
jgi:hypothetical protein